MTWKSALNTSAVSLILSLQAVGTGSFFIPAEAINSPANSLHRPSTPQLPLNWQTAQPPERPETEPTASNPEPLGITFNRRNREYPEGGKGEEPGV